MKEKKLKLTTDMFRPVKSGESNPSMDRLLATVGGPAWPLMKEDQLQGRLDTDRLATYTAAIDHHVYEVIRNEHNLGRADMQTFFDMQQETSRIVIEDIIKKFMPDLSTRIGLSNEVSLLKGPGHILSFLARGNEISDVLRFEVSRHLLTSLTMSTHHARSANGGLRSVLSDAQSLMNKFLYDGPEGQTHTHHEYVVFNNETNTPVSIYVPNRFVSSGDHVKDFVANTRRIRKEICEADIEGDRLFTDTRVKSAASSFIKVLMKALLNGGELKVDGDVRDNMGMMMTIYGNDSDRDQIIHRLSNVFNLHPNGVRAIEEDNDSEGDRGQAKVQFKRMQVFLNGTEYPIEVMAYSLLDYLRSRYEVGRINPSTGMYDGAAHSLYEFRRSIPVTGLLFPAEIYGVDSRTTIIHHMNQTAEDLRIKDRVRI